MEFMDEDNKKVIKKIIKSIQFPIDGDTKQLVYNCLKEMAEYKDKQYNDLSLILKNTIGMVDTKDEVIKKLHKVISNIT